MSQTPERSSQPIKSAVRRNKLLLPHAPHYNFAKSFAEKKIIRIFVAKQKMPMPTLFIIFGFRFMFYSDDHEPIHVHVLKENHEAKYNVEELKQVFNHGFKKHELSMIESIIEENKEVIIERWENYFNKA